MSASYDAIQEGALATPALFNDRFDSLQKGDVFNVKAYGAVGDGTTDDGDAFALTAAAIQANGGGTFFCPPAEYMLYKVGTTYGNIGVFASLNGISILAPDATFKIDPARTFTTSYGNIFQFAGCENITINVARVTGPNVVTEPLTGVKGVVFASFNSACKGICAPYINIEGGCIAGLLFDGDATDDDQRCKDIDVGVLKIKNSWYGINCQWSGDNLRAGLIKSDGVYRAYFIYGVHNHVVNIEAKDHQATHVIITSLSGKGCEDITVKYTARESTAAAGAPHINIGFSEDAGYHRKIALDLNVKLDGAANGGPVVLIDKTIVATGAPDTADRGHIFDGLTISGRVEGNATELTNGLIGTHGDCDWGTGDFWSNFHLKDLTVTDGRYLDFICGSLSNITLTNVRSDDTIRLRESSASTQTSSVTKIEVINCDFPNLYDFVGADSAYPIAHRVSSDASYTIGAGWCNGPTVTNQFAAGTQTVTLPASVAGMRISFRRVITQTLRIDPDGTEVIRGGGAGKYASLDSDGAFLRLHCHVAGTWEIESSYGTISYQP